MFLFRGLDLHIISLDDLNIDDINNVRICYIDEVENVRERKKQLKDSFYFDCQCQRCLTSDNEVRRGRRRQEVQCTNNVSNLHFKLSMNVNNIFFCFVPHCRTL